MKKNITQLQSIKNVGDACVSTDESVEIELINDKHEIDFRVKFPDFPELVAGKNIEIDDADPLKRIITPQTQKSRFKKRLIKTQIGVVIL